MGSNKIKKILITGGSGLVGKYLFTKLSKAGYQIDILARHSGKYKTDIRDKKLKLANYDLVIHLAAVTGMFDKECMQTNFEGTKNLLSKLKLNKSTNFLFFSSIEAYGMTNINKVNNKMLEHPHSVYGKSKLLAENYIEKFAKKNENFRYLILRLGNITSNLDDSFENKIKRLAKKWYGWWLFSGYELNLLRMEEVCWLVEKIINKNFFKNKTYFVVGKEISVSKLTKKTIFGPGMVVSGLFFRLLGLFGRGGFYYYLTAGGIRRPFRRYDKKIWKYL